MIIPSATAMMLASTSLILTSSYLFLYRPWRKYNDDVKQTRRYAEEQAEKKAKAEHAKMIRERRKAVYQVSRKLKAKVIEAFSLLDFRYAPRSWEKKSGRRRWQEMQLSTTILGLDYCVFRVDRYPYKVKPSDIVKDETIFNIRHHSGRPDLEVILTPRDGTFIYVPLKGSASGIPSLVPWRDRTQLSWMKYMHAGPFYMNAGMGFNRRAHVIDLRKEPHVLVAGSSGSGKSIALGGIICTAALLNSPQNLRMAFVDMKRVGLKIYNDLPHLWKPVVVRHKEVKTLFEEVRDLVDERYELMDKNGVMSIDQWNKKYPESKMYRLWVIMDEMADFMLDREIGTTVTNILERLSAISRATGIHLVMCTQRPSTDVITGLVKANAPARLALRCSSNIDSRVIIDNGLAEGLKPRGRAILKSQGSFTQVQVPFLPEEEIGKVVKEICHKWHIQERPNDAELLALAVQKSCSLLDLMDLFYKKYEMSADEVFKLVSRWQYVPDLGKPHASISGGKYIFWYGKPIPYTGKNPPSILEHIEISGGI